MHEAGVQGLLGQLLELIGVHAVQVKLARRQDLHQTLLLGLLAGKRDVEHQLVVPVLVVSRLGCVERLQRVSWVLHFDRLGGILGCLGSRLGSSWCWGGVFSGLDLHEALLGLFVLYKWHRWVKH